MKKSGGAKIALLILGGIATILVGFYIGGVIFFQNRYLMHTKIADLECSAKMPEDVEDKIAGNIGDYLLTIRDRKGNSFHLRGMDFGYSYVKQKEEQEILQTQNAFLWPVSLWKESSYSLRTSVSYDEKALKKQVEALGLFDESYIQPPEDAKVEFTDEGYEIIPEVYGNQPVFEQVLTEIQAAVDAQESELLISDVCYVRPKICSDDPTIRVTTDQLDIYLNATIHYEIEGVEENLTRKKIMSLLLIDDAGIVTVNEPEVEKYVQYLASTYNTYADVREVKTSLGDVVSIGGGDYGWVIQKNAEKEQILKDLAGGVPVSREPVYEQRAIQGGLDDIGNTYVEIDYTNQHLWYYKEGELVTETDIVSGNLSGGNGSPDGVYKIVYKEQNAKLVGENYATPVSYFMPFAYNVGIHDATWRSSFGGSIYKTSGSHGCINVPFEIAEILYQTLEVGTPVIAYYREPVVLSGEYAKMSNAFSYVAPENIVKPEDTDKADESTEKDDKKKTDKKQDKKDKKKKKKNT